MGKETLAIIDEYLISWNVEEKLGACKTEKRSAIT